jgi:hypothetical protein
MTNPLGQGSSSWARTTRFGELQWGMPRKKLLSMFASSRVFPRYEGKNPRTGKPVIVPESVALPSEPPPTHDVAVFGSVTFDADEGLASIMLKSTYPRPADTTDAQLLVAANKVIAALGIEPIDTLPAEPRKWKHKSTSIELDYDDECFWFELSPV